MSTGTPVVVSRIQNRRGFQTDFNNLYPSGQPGTGPNVLQPGELALCTDTGRVFMGTVVNGINGYYIELTAGGGGSLPPGALELTPVVVSLPPAATWTSMLTPFTPTPFFTMLNS